MNSFVLSKIRVPYGGRSSRIEAAMNLRSDFEAAWKAGEGHDTLLELVRRHKTQGLPVQEAYQILLQLWLECGFNDAEQSSALQDNLEYVLEKLWYECPATK
jgi:hypothetical protein